MARLNIEDSFWTDDSYLLLVGKVGPDTATGMCIRFMKVAQKYWVKGELVPLEILERNGWQALIESGFAVSKDQGVYCRGSEESFDWIVQRSEAGRLGGLKSGTTKKSDSSDQANASKRKQSGSKRKPPTPTPTPTLTLSSSSSSLSSPAETPPPGKMSVETLRKIWNEHKHDSMAACQRISPNTERYILATARVTEIPDPEYWQQVVKRIAESPHCRGENDRGWKAHFLWLVKPDSHNRTMEGLYDRKTPPAPKLRPDLRWAEAATEPEPELTPEQIASRKAKLREAMKR